MGETHNRGGSQCLHHIRLCGVVGALANGRQIDTVFTGGGRLRRLLGIEESRIGKCTHDENNKKAKAQFGHRFLRLSSLGTQNGVGPR